MTNEELFVATAIATWKLSISRLNQMLSKLSDEELQKEVSPGRNRVYYLLGHLAAIHDRMFPLLRLGERLHPELDETFIDNPDRKFPDSVSSLDLRKVFEKVNTKLTAAMEALPAHEWLNRHESVSETDFAKDPLRNRLSVLQTRTAHASFHGGQIRLLL